MEQVRQTQAAILSHITEPGIGKHMPFAPHYGVRPLPKEEEIPGLLKQRAAEHALLIGCNERETAAYIGGSRIIAAMDRFPVTRPLVEMGIRKTGKAVFETPSRSFAAQYAAAGGQCWYYNFSWCLNRSVVGACHCMELVALFGGKGLEGRPVMMSQTERDVRAAGRPLREIWTDFAKTGAVNKPEVQGMLTVFKQA